MIATAYNAYDPAWYRAATVPNGLRLQAQDGDLLGNVKNTFTYAGIAGIVGYMAPRADWQKYAKYAAIGSGALMLFSTGSTANLGRTILPVAGGYYVGMELARRPAPSFR